MNEAQRWRVLVDGKILVAGRRRFRLEKHLEVSRDEGVWERASPSEICPEGTWRVEDRPTSNTAAIVVLIVWALFVIWFFT